MRIIQILGTLSFGDAIGNHVIALKKVIQDAGFTTEIYAESIDSRIPNKIAKLLTPWFRPKASDIVIYHMSVGCPLNMRFGTWKCRKVLMYHNITPPEHFEPYSLKFAGSLREGLVHTVQLKDSVDYCLAMSELNKRDLVAIGYPSNRIWVMPAYLIPFEDYAKQPDQETLKKYSDDWINLLFVGRLAPNKRQEDVIRTFAHYKKHINPNSRLFLVGSTTVPDYTDALKDYVNALGVTDVIFPGHISFSQIIAIYRSASAFLCMSEHEGFCVPLVEAMYFDVPIIAYNAAAVPETLDGSGVLMDSKDPILWAAWIDRIVTDSGLRNQMLIRQRDRLAQLQPQVVERAFLNYLKQII